MAIDKLDYDHKERNEDHKKPLESKESKNTKNTVRSVSIVDGDKINIPYDVNGVKHDMKIEKSKGELVITMTADGKTISQHSYKQGPDKNRFSMIIGGILDSDVGIDRPKIPQKVEQAYKLREIQDHLSEFSIDHVDKRLEFDIELTYLHRGFSEVSKDTYDISIKKGKTSGYDVEISSGLLLKEKRSKTCTTIQDTKAILLLRLEEVSKGATDLSQEKAIKLINSLDAVWSSV